MALVDPGLKNPGVQVTDINLVQILLECAAEESRTERQARKDAIIFGDTR